MLKYWFRLVTLPHDRLVSHCYWSLLNKPDTQDSWLSSIKNIIDSSGLSYIWADQKLLHQLDPKGISNLTSKILKSHESQLLQNTDAEIRGQSKLHLFKNISKTLKPAPYLSKLANRSERSLYAKLRLGTLKLEIETGRHEKLESNVRFCKLCKSNNIGNECHFLFDCPALESTRQPHLEHFLSTHQHFKHLSSLEKTKFLFFNNQLDDPTLLSSSAFLLELFERRSTLIKELNTEA